MRTLFLGLALFGIWGLTAAHSQTRQPRIESVMTPADRVLIVEALTKANSSLAKAYSEGAPLRWWTAESIESALRGLGTSEAADLISRIEATRPKPIEAGPTLPVPPHPPLTFNDGYRKSWLEVTGPLFVVQLSAAETDVVRRAFDKLEDEHINNKAGIDDYLMGRRKRILEELDQGGFGLFIGGPGGWEDRSERSYPLTLLEMTLIGFAVSRDRYCRAEDQDVDELGFLEAGVECYIRNTAAIALLTRFEKARHVSPGGANR